MDILSKSLCLKVLLIISLAIISTSCGDTSTITSVDSVPITDRPIINPNTKPIDDFDWLDFIEKIDSTNFTLTFEDRFEEAENWKQGDLLVSAVGEGLLRTVTAVATESNTIVVETEQATLVDYLQQGRIQERVSLELEDVQKVTYLREGVLLLQEPDEVKAHKLYAEKSRGLPWKLDTEFTGEGSIEIFGDYLLETDIILDLEVYYFTGLNYFEMSYELKNTLEVGMKAEQNLKVSSSTDIANVTFNPIIIPVAVLPVPIVLTPSLVVSIGVDGEVSGEIYTDVTYQDIFKVGTAFQRGDGWSEIIEREESFEYNPPALGLGAKVEANLSAKYNMALYGVLSGYLTSTIYSIAEAELNRDPWWELYLGLRGGLGTSAKIISIDLFDINRDDLIDYQWTIAQAESGPDFSTPTVTTSSVTSITSQSAQGGGNVTDDGGASVSARGICWSTLQNPTTGDNCTSDGNGSGSYTSSMTNLSSDTQYYVRAYATNSEGTSYGNQRPFSTTTAVSLPVVSTKHISSITPTMAEGGGTVTDSGGASVTQRGICWSTSPNPDSSNDCSEDGSGSGEFNSSLRGLSPETIYYVRAYAVNSAGAAYGNQVDFTTADADERDNDLSICETWSVSQSGGAGVTVDNWDISTLPTGVTFDIQFNAYVIPDKFVVEYPIGTEKLDTGWRGSSSYNGNPDYPGGIEGPGQGTVEDIFQKGSVNTFRVVVTGIDNSTAWNYRVRCRNQ